MSLGIELTWLNFICQNWFWFKSTYSSSVCLHYFDSVIFYLL